MPNPAAYNLDFRPESYWDSPDPVSAILQNVKGDQRRAIIRDRLEATAEGREPDEELDPELYEDSLSDDSRDEVGAIHPAFMGGEYLPNHRPSEVEIARLVLDSTTRDVYSVRARRGSKDGQIRYRIVDEYGAKWTISPKSSARPLAMKELIDLIDSATYQDEDGDAPGDWKDLTDFLRESADSADFVEVSSDVYPQLKAWYREKAEEWRERHFREI